MENKKQKNIKENIDVLANLEIDTDKSLLKDDKESNKENYTIENEFYSHLNTYEKVEVEKEKISINNEKSKWDVSKKESKFKKVLSYIVFSFKYILSSSLIFAFLLISTNYSAYSNIAKSYVFKEKFEENNKSLVESVNAWYIKEKINQKYEEEDNLRKDEAEKDKKYSKNDHSIFKLVKEANKEDINLKIEMTPYENRIVIPKIWKNVPLVDVQKKTVSWEKELNDIFMKELEKWVVRYPSSAKPWNEWNSFIFGHSSNFPWMKWNYNDVFSLLDNVEFNDEIIVYYWQKKYVYKIREKKVIKPWDVSILKRDKKRSELTLMTCWPIWTTLNRLIVTWDLVVSE